MLFELYYVFMVAVGRGQHKILMQKRGDYFALPWRKTGETRKFDVGAMDDALTAHTSVRILLTHEVLANDGDKAVARYYYLLQQPPLHGKLEAALECAQTLWPGETFEWVDDFHVKRLLKAHSSRISIASGHVLSDIIFSDDKSVRGSAAKKAKTSEFVVDLASDADGAGAAADAKSTSGFAGRMQDSADFIDALMPPDDTGV